MTNAEILKTVGELFNTGISKLDDKYSKGMNNIAARMALDKLADKHEDFDTQFPKMQELWKQVPQLDAEKCYRLAKFGTDEAIEEIITSRKAEADKAKAQGSITGSPPGINFQIDEQKTPEQNIDSAFDTIFGAGKE